MAAVDVLIGWICGALMVTWLSRLRHRKLTARWQSVLDEAMRQREDALRAVRDLMRRGSLQGPLCPDCPRKGVLDG